MWGQVNIMNIPVGKMGWLNKYAEVVDRYRVHPDRAAASLLEDVLQTWVKAQAVNSNAV